MLNAIVRYWKVKTKCFMASPIYMAGITNPPFVCFQTVTGAGEEEEEGGEGDDVWDDGAGDENGSSF